MVVFCLAFAAFPSAAGETGIEGTVLWGPVDPGPTQHGQSDEAPLQATFAVTDDGVEVARFQSDTAGAFRVALPPGDYLIVPDANTPIPFPTKQITRVTVPDDGYATVSIRLDTGMR